MSVPGDILDPDPPVAQLLIERGVAEVVEAKAVEPERKIVESPVRDKMVKRSALRRVHLAAGCATELKVSYLGRSEFEIE